VGAPSISFSPSPPLRLTISTADPSAEPLITDDAVLADLPRRSARGGVIQVGAQGIQLLLTVASGAVLARLLSPVDFGIVGMAATLTSLASVVRDFGLPMATVQRAELDERDVSSLFWMGLRLNLALAVGLVLAAPAAASLYDEPRVVEVVAIVALSGIVAGMSAQHEALLIRQMRFATLRAVDLSSLAVAMIAGIVFAMAGAGYRALVWQSFLGVAIRTIALWRASGWRPAPDGPRSERVAVLASFGWNHTGAKVLRHIAQNTDQAVVGYLFGARQLGFYDSAYRWSISAMQQIYTPLQNVAVSGLSRLQHDPRVFRVAARRALLPVFSAILPVLAYLAVQARPVVLALLGDRWEPSAPLFRVLCIAAMGSVVARGANWLYLAEGRTRRQLRWGFVALPVVVVAVFLGATRGPLGVAMGFATANWLLAVPEVLFCLRGSRVTARDYFAAVGRPLAAAAVAAVAVAVAFAWRGDAGPTAGVDVVRLMLSSFVFGVVYLLTWLAIPGGRGAARELVTLWRASTARRTSRA